MKMGQVVGPLVIMAAIGALIGVLDHLVSSREKEKAVLAEQVSTERTERQQYLDGLGNPYLEPDYYKGLSPVDISANYNMVCIHGMPYFKSRLTGGELLAIPPYKWKISHWAWRACRGVYEPN